MKIVHVEDYFHPEAGYQINILPKYMKKMGHEVTIITSEMDKIPDLLTSFFGKNDIENKDLIYTKETGVKIIRLPLFGFVSGRAIFTNNLFKVIENENPDVVYIHGNDTLTGMRYLIRRAFNRYPTVMDSHMLEMASANKFNNLFRRFYKLIFTPMIIKNQIPIIRTQNDNYVEKCLGIPLEKSPWISVGSDTLQFKPDVKNRMKLREKMGIGKDDFVFIYAGKLDETKGGLLLAQSILEPICTCDKHISFIIIGNTSGEYGKKVETLFSNSKNNILRLPTQKYKDLALYYQASDMAIFPRQCSLSFYDVQACGLPVIFEENSVNISRSKDDSTIMFEADNYEKLRLAIEYACSIDEDRYFKMSSNSMSMVKKEYDYMDIAELYMQIIERTVKNYNIRRNK